MLFCFSFKCGLTRWAAMRFSKCWTKIDNPFEVLFLNTRRTTNFQHYFVSFFFLFLFHMWTWGPETHYSILPQDLEDARWRFTAQTQARLLGGSRSPGTEHVDQCQCRADIATTDHLVRRRGYFSGAATCRNGSNLVAETASTTKHVVRSDQQGAAHKILVFPGLTMQASEFPRACQ